MKMLGLVMWVTQFGLSAIFPTLFFLWLAVWLRGEFGFGMWIVAVCGIIGILTSISTTRSCYRSMCKAAKELSSQDEPPVAFNNHN